ncbi:MAG TPA: cohesin domain-containing protein [Armatimonadota bacterium]|jgi:hypothetical protein
MNAARILAAGAIAGLMTGGAARAGTVALTGPANASPGGTVTVSVTLTPDLNNVYALQAALTYDPVVLTLLPTQDTSAPQSYWTGASTPFPGETIPRDADLFRMNPSQLGVVVFGYVKNPSNPAGSSSKVVPATALRLSFAVAPGATGSTTVRLAPYTVNGRSMPELILGASDGAPIDAGVGVPLVITFRMPGDVNGDGVVGLGDVVMALQLSGGVQLGTGDRSSIVNGDVSPAGAPDGKVKVDDAIRILRFIHGFETTLN